MSSINSSFQLFEDMLRVQSKFLGVLTVNFQSIHYKKDELSSFLIENDIDIVLGSETHLSPSINNAEVLPLMYSSFRRDRVDGWSGIIIVTKKNVTAEEIKIKKECKMVAIIVETYQKPVILASCYKLSKNTFNELLFVEIKQLTNMQRKNPTWIDRGFNLPDIDWKVKSINN